MEARSIVVEHEVPVLRGRVHRRKCNVKRFRAGGLYRRIGGVHGECPVARGDSAYHEGRGPGVGDYDTVEPVPAEVDDAERDRFPVQ